VFARRRATMTLAFFEQSPARLRQA
jgi:hypothetical protein